MAISQTTNSTSATWSVNGVDVLSTNSTGEVSARLNGALTPLTNMQRILQGTPVATTSGTFVDFTGIPSWAKEITVMFNGVSTNGTSTIIIQLGASSIVTSGYFCAAGRAVGTSVATANFTNGFAIAGAPIASSIFHGNILFSNTIGNTWTSSYTLGQSDSANVVFGGGSISLASTLDRIRITTVNGTDAFDGGSVNILIKG